MQIRMLDIEVPINATTKVRRECPAYELPILKALFENDMTGDINVIDDSRSIQIDGHDAEALLSSLSSKYPGDKTLAEIKRIYPTVRAFENALEDAKAKPAKPKAKSAAKKDDAPPKDEDADEDEQGEQ